MDLDDFRLGVSHALGLDNSAAADQPFIDSWVNRGVVDVLVKTHCQVREGDINLTSGTSVYPLNADILAIKDVWNEALSADYPMERVPIDYMNRLRRNDGSLAAAPARYYNVQGSDFLKLWPIPGSGESLRIDYVPRPATLVNGSDTPSEIPVEWHDAVELFALWKGADADDDSTSQDGDRYHRDYLLYIRDMKIALGEKQGNWGRVIVNRRRTRRRSHHPSQYPQFR